MNTEKDPYWDDLGVAWHVVEPDPKAIEARVSARLRSQAFFTHLFMILGIPSCLAMLALAAYTVYAGLSDGAWNFVVRGAALLVLSAMMGTAVWFQRAKARDDQDSVARTLELAITRSHNLRRAAGIGMAMCAVAAVFGVAGYLVRVAFSHPPAMSPWEPLAFLTLVATVLFTYLRYTTGELGRLHYLKRALCAD